MQEARFLTIESAASYLSLSQTTIKKMLREKELTKVKIGASTRIDRADLDRWADAQKAKAIQ